MKLISKCSILNLLAYLRLNLCPISALKRVFSAEVDFLVQLLSSPHFSPLRFLPLHSFQSKNLLSYL